MKIFFILNNLCREDNTFHQNKILFRRDTEKGFLILKKKLFIQ